MQIGRIAGLLLFAATIVGCPSQPEGSPTASFTRTPTYGPKEVQVDFTDTSDPGDAPISSWLWEFGDGGIGTLQNPSHVYTSKGTYNVTLTVSNGIGESSTEMTEAVIVGDIWAATDGFAGDDTAESVAVSNNGDLYILSAVTQNGMDNTDLQLQRRTAKGEKVWTRLIGGDKDELAGAVIVDSGEIVVCGSTRSFGAGGWDAYVVRLDSDGGEVWSETYGTFYDEKASDITACSGGFAIAGQTSSSGTFPNCYLFKIESDGEQVWSKSYGDASYTEFAHGVRTTSDDGFIIAGEQLRASSDMYVVRADKDGKEVWKGNFGGTGTERGYEPFQVSGEYVIIGLGYSETITANDVMMLRLDKDGKKLTTAFLGGTGREEGLAAIQLGGNFIIAGNTSTATAGGRDVYLVSAKSNGEKNWSRTLGGPADDKANALLTVDTEFVVVGSTASWGEGGTDSYLLRTNNLGLGPVEPDPAL